jgi:hypothetical protein
MRRAVAGPHGAFSCHSLRARLPRQPTTPANLPVVVAAQRFRALGTLSGIEFAVRIGQALEARAKGRPRFG